MLQKREKDNKNITLVMGIILLFLIFMLVSVILVVNQVNQGSSAEMLKKRSASAVYYHVKLFNV
ncbi:MAG: hypothetical protein U9Q90_06640 [Campylobacterota bacterium]|nr:hypothetical protein [Campylobacterota bacterium]